MHSQSRLTSASRRVQADTRKRDGSTGRKAASAKPRGLWPPRTRPVQSALLPAYRQKNRAAPVAMKVYTQLKAMPTVWKATRECQQN